MYRIVSQARLAGLDEFGHTLIVGLEHRVAAFESQVLELTNELTGARASLETEQSKTRCLMDERISLQANIAALYADISTIQTSHHRISALLRDAEEQKKDALAEADAHRRMAANMNTAVSVEHRNTTRHKAVLSLTQNDVQELKISLRDLEESRRLATGQLEATKEALVETTTHHSAAEAKSAMLQQQLDVLSCSLTFAYAKKADLEASLAKAIASAEKAALTTQELQAALVSEQDKCKEMQAELRRTMDLLVSADDRTTALQAKLDTLKESPSSGDDSCASGQDALDVSLFALDLERDLLETQYEDEVAAHSATKMLVEEMSVQLQASLKEVARLKAREEVALSENVALKFQMREERGARDGVLFDLQETLSELSSLSVENADVNVRLQTAENAFIASREYSHSMRLERDLALRQLSEQHRQQESELQAKVVEEEKAQFVIAELNRKKRELGTSKKSLEKTLLSRVHRCEKLEREVNDLTTKLESQSVSTTTPNGPATPQSKSANGDKENSIAGSTNRLLCKVSLVSYFAEVHA